jgi:hypothetical protein
MARQGQKRDREAEEARGAAGLAERESRLRWLPADSLLFVSLCADCHCYKNCRQPKKRSRLPSAERAREQNRTESFQHTAHYTLPIA